MTRVPHEATARRPRWDDLPAAVRVLVERRHGSPVVAATSRDAGFTPACASRLRCADGSTLFVKALDTVAHPHLAGSYAQEAAVAALLPATVPAPRLRWAQVVDGWQVLAFDDVPSRTPVRPWRPAELDAALATLVAAAAALTPAPDGLDLPTVADLDDQLSTWRALAAGTLDAALAPPAWRDRVPELAALEARVGQACAGSTAVHLDVRDDNLLLTDDGRVLVCDWSWMVLGAPWVDTVGLLVGAHGDGLDADGLLAAHPLTRDVPAADVDAFLVALAGYFVEASARPEVDTSPYLRTHQRWYRDATLTWLATRRPAAP